MTFDAASSDGRGPSAKLPAKDLVVCCDEARFRLVTFDAASSDGRALSAKLTAKDLVVCCDEARFRLVTFDAASSDGRAPSDEETAKNLVQRMLDWQEVPFSLGTASCSGKALPACLRGL